jgi:hypothetical protein
MGFKSNINYAGYERLKQRGEEGITRAKYVKKKEEEAEARRAAAEAAAAATRRSGQRSGLQKLGSAALRAGAAYYTGGASEALGFGGAIDDVVLGKDDQGNSIQNEYGEIVRAGSGIYGAMKGKKAGDVARKRGSNVQDYNEQVALATEMGKLDKTEGRNMLLDAQKFRARQQAQTQAGEDASVWGWDNEFDTLTPSQQAGAEISPADIKNMAPSVKEIEEKYDADRLKVAAEEKYRGPTGEELDKGWRERQQMRMPTPRNIREQVIEEDISSKQELSPVVKRENARIARREAMADMMDREMDERSTEKLLDYDPALETTTTKFKGSPISKTYLEKAALEADRNFNAKDKISDQLDEAKLLKKAKDSKYNQLIEGGYGAGFLPQSMRNPRIVEAELMQRRMEENARKRREDDNEMIRFSGGQYNPYESPLLKRMRAKRKAKGSILHS